MNSKSIQICSCKSLTLVAAAICAALMTACATVSDSAIVSDNGAEPGVADWEMPIDRELGLIDGKSERGQAKSGFLCRQRRLAMYSTKVSVCANPNRHRGIDPGPEALERRPRRLRALSHVYASALLIARSQCIVLAPFALLSVPADPTP